MGSERKPVIYAKGLYKIYRVGETQVRAFKRRGSFHLSGGILCHRGDLRFRKSTLLNMLAGLENLRRGRLPSAGVVWIR